MADNFLNRSFVLNGCKYVVIGRGKGTGNYQVVPASLIYKEGVMVSPKALEKFLGQSEGDTLSSGFKVAVSMNSEDPIYWVGESGQLVVSCRDALLFANREQAEGVRKLFRKDCHWSTVIHCQQ